ncbi:MAG: hypothetical protein JRN20_06940 [Nitrososphaerota archaeon]|nr:hypothetical protein [Nitrososphaerota archaeon]
MPKKRAKQVKKVNKKPVPRKAKKKAGVSVKKVVTRSAPDSYELWLERQVKQTGKGQTKSKAGQTSGALPADTLNAWLAKQQVVEKQPGEESAKMPADTFEEWIKKQATERQSSPEPAEEQKVEEKPAANVAQEEAPSGI